MELLKNEMALPLPSFEWENGVLVALLDSLWIDKSFFTGPLGACTFFSVLTFSSLGFIQSLVRKVQYRFPGSHSYLFFSLIHQFLMLTWQLSRFISEGCLKTPTRYTASKHQFKTPTVAASAGSSLPATLDCMWKWEKGQEGSYAADQWNPNLVQPPTLNKINM